MVAVVGNTTKGTINVDYKAIMEVFVKVYFEIIAKKSARFIRSQIAN